MKRAATIILTIFLLFSFSSCYNYKLFGPAGSAKGNYYTKWADNAPGTSFNTHKRYNKKNVNMKKHKKEKFKRKNNSYGCNPFRK